MRFLRPVRLGAVLGLMVLAGAAGCSATSGGDADVGVDTTDSANTASQAAARAIRMARFKESLAPVMRGVINDPTEIGVTVRAALADSERVIFNTQIPRDAPVNQVRKAVAALGKSKLTRRMMVKNSQQALERRSSKLKEVMSGRLVEPVPPGTPLTRIDGKSLKYDGGMPNMENVFDELVVGTGPQGVAYMQQMTDSAALKRVLAVDAASKPGGTFAEVGEAFALNSTNRANTGTRAKPGEGDLNFIQDIWGLPDFEGQKWVPAGGLADLSTVGSDLASAEVMFGTKVTKILDKLQEPGSDAWPARYMVEIADVGDGTVNKVFTNKVVVASGIGTPTIPIKDESTLKLIAEEAARVDLDPEAVPGIQTFTNLVNRIGQSDTPYRWAVGKDVVVAGGGDSAKVINEFLFRLAPDGAYAQDVAQVGNVKRVFWLGVSFEDCQAYIAQSRARYARLASALASGELVPVPGKIVKIERAGNGYKLAYQTADGKLFENGIQYKTPAKDGVQPNDVLFSDPVDNIVLATGFRSEAEDVLAKLVVAKGAQLDAATFGRVLALTPSSSVSGKNLGDLWGGVSPDLVVIDELLRQNPNGTTYYADLLLLREIVSGETSTLRRSLVDVTGRPEGFAQDVAIATRLRGANEPQPHDIFFVGPSNEARGGLPKQDELAGVNANTVSLFANVQRTRLLAQRSAETSGLGLKGIKELTEVPKIGELFVRRTPAPNPAVTFGRANPAAPLAELSAVADIDVGVQVAKVFQRFEVPAGANVKIVVTKSGDKIAVTISDLATTSATQLSNALVRDNAQTAEMLFAFFGANGKAIKSLEINVPTYGPNSSQIREVGIEVLRRK